MTNSRQEQADQAARHADGRDSGRPPIPARGLFGIRVAAGTAPPPRRRRLWLEGVRTLI